MLLLVMCGAWGIVTYFVFADASEEVHELFDANLSQNARVLMDLMSHEAEEGHVGLTATGAEFAAAYHKYETELAYVVRDQDGTLMASSASAPAFPLAGDGYHDFFVGDDAWRVFTLRSPTPGLIVQTGEPKENRDELAREVVLHAVVPILLLLPALIAAVLLGVTRGLRPLGLLAGQISKRAPNAMDPVDAGGAPAEIRPLVDSLNTLLERLRHALARERRFTGDAAHELRTPLAALKTNAQVAIRATSDEQRMASLTALEEGVDRASHLVDQLLSLARLDAPAGAAEQRRVDLVPVVRDVLAELAPAALEAGVEVALEATNEDAMITGDRHALWILARNLIDNAVRYTPAGGTVQVCVTTCADAVALSVVDSGSGIPSTERERVFERFYRGARTTAPGSGLGLSIVRAIAAQHGGRVELADAPGGTGLACRVCFARRVAPDPRVPGTNTAPSDDTGSRAAPPGSA